jgi:D-sedoheptulose 7-phosphate isomerase
LSISERIRKARRVYIIGNGGSYANAMHIANDLNSCGVRAHTLDPATLTAWANDYGYEFVFSKWIILNGEPGDMLIALSGSGTSPNILNAVQAARISGMDVECVFGAPKLGMQEAEERQIELGHEVMRALKCA